jgi:hypothetical protein
MSYFYDSADRRYPSTELLEFIKQKNEDQTPDLTFRRLESYYTLFDNKVILPEVSFLRIDDGGVCENYTPISREIVRGANFAYNEITGDHSIEKVFKQFGEQFTTMTISGIYVPERFVKSNLLWEVYNESNPPKKITISHQ